MTTEKPRPNPDDLLKGVQEDERLSRRGRLRVFFGMCPGVGKTFSMLRAARDKKVEGLDVVVGVVETHGRDETAELLKGFEVIPKKQISYRSTVLEEMDLDAILARRPQLVLVDELAHSNAPGSRHTKRYQDVEELLVSGIDVYTTLNVQHIESRSDLVFQITAIPVQEKVPDSFLELADQIELIDISPESLLRRLAEGRVYLGERAARAADNFFKIENIIALRELALRFTAEKVDEQLRRQRVLKQVPGIWNINERLMVAVGYSPYSARLIRATRRMAYNLEAPWIALFVDTGEELNSRDQRQLQKNLNLARELGAEVVHTRDQSIPNALRRVAHEKNVTQIVIGRPDKRFVRDFLNQGTILEQLVRETSEIDIHVIRQERKPKYKGFHLIFPKLKSGFVPYWFTLWFVTVVALASYASLPWIGYRAIGFVFLSAVLIVGAMARFGPILFAAIWSALIWNYFFIPPQFTFAIKETEDVMNVFALFVVAFALGYLTSRIKKQEADLADRAHISAVLYEFARNLSDAKSLPDIATAARESLGRIFNTEMEILLKTSEEDLNPSPVGKAATVMDAKELAVATWSFRNGKRAGLGTETLSSSPCLSIPLIGRGSTIGVLLLWPQDGHWLDIERESLIDTFASNIAIACERENLAKKSVEAEILASSEKLHQALLNSVSHELKTPLTAIIGNASALKQGSRRLSDSNREQLMDDLIESTERLNRVVENLLDMSRISTGSLRLKEELFEMNDFVESTLSRARAMVRRHKLKFIKDDENVYVRGDDRLLEHVLLNLLANAVAYSKEGSEIEVKVSGDKGRVFIHVCDHGSGIPESDLERVFERFYRVPGAPTGGTGLGLSIAKAIVEAQGGGIHAANNKSKPGCTFAIWLPRTKVELDENGLVT